MTSAPTVPRRRRPPWDPQIAWSRAELKELEAGIDRLARESIARRTSRKSISTPRFRRILVAIDGADRTYAALDWAREFARGAGGRVWVLTVLAPTYRAPPRASSALRQGMLRVADQEEKTGRRIVEDGVARLQRYRVPAKALLRRGRPASQIEVAARDLQADLVVLGSHGHSRRDRRRLGSVVDSVKNRLRSSLLIAKAPPAKAHVLVPVDGSRTSHIAARLAVGIAAAWRRQATVLHVFEIPWLGWRDRAPASFKAIIRSFELPVRPKGIRYVLDYGKPAAKILAYEKRLRPSLLITGARGRGRLRTLILGSVSARLTHESVSSILVVKDP